jgi:hypothetical protein
VRLPRPVNRAETDQYAQPDGRVKDVAFACCISCGILTWIQWSRPYRISSRTHGLLRGLPYTAATFLFGWWGLPWGVLLSPRAIWTNCTGGVEVPWSESESVKGL